MKLYEKLREETEEPIRDRNIGEVADVLEIIDAIVSCEGFS
jgi:predicted house-cleaning noncanonical NTP pyrophosphatase (MazG superfamily)